MSLEVDGRQGAAPIPFQREDENFKYLNEADTQWHHGQNSYEEGAQEKQLDSEPSKPTRRFHGKKIVVSSRVIVFWSVTFGLVSVLAVVAAGVVGSLAARRGRSLSSWSVLFLHALSRRANADSSIQV